MALILYYHKIHKTPREGLWYKSFDLQLRLLKSRFKVVPPGEICSALTERRPMAKNWVAITFDDGYADNLVYAYPLLKKHGLKAALFPAFSRLRASDDIRPTLEDYWAGKVSFGELHTPLTMSRANLEHFEKGSSADFLTFSELKKISDIFEIGGHASEHARVFAGGEINDFCDGKNVKWTHCRAFGEKPGPGWPLVSMKSSIAAARGTLKPAARDFVRSLDGAFFRRKGWKPRLKAELEAKFGEVFTFESEAGKEKRVAEEIVSSKAGLEAALGRRIRYFSYPFGEYDTRLSRIVAENFSAAVTTQKKPVTAETDPYLIPRASVSDDIFTFTGVLLKYRLGRL